MAEKSAFEVTKAALPDAKKQCEVNGYDNDLLKTSELETLYSKGILTTVITKESENTGADIMFAASDSCYDRSDNGASSCPEGYKYSVIYPKTFTK